MSKKMVDLCAICQGQIKDSRFKEKEYFESKDVSIEINVPSQKCIDCGEGYIDSEYILLIENIKKEIT